MADTKVETQTCRSCDRDLPLEQYYFQAKRGYREKRCMDCTKARKRAHWSAQDKTPEFIERQRANSTRKALRAKGITEKQYDELLQAQGGVCAICQRPETSVWQGAPRRLAVDHDRSCCPGDAACGGCVRGLLCFSCNVLLGRARDDEALLYRAITYLMEARRDG